MKSLYKFMLLVGFLMISTGVYAFHSTASIGCGTVCGKANIDVWLYSTIDQYWEDNNTDIPDELYWTGEYYFKIVDKNTGVTQTLVGNTFINLLVFTTTYSDGSKISSMDKTRFMPAADLSYDLPVDAGVYDIYEYAHYTLTGTGYSQTFTYGSLAVPQTMSDLEPYPLYVQNYHVQNSNMPDDISIDGYRGSLYDPIPVYTCKNAWPIRLYYDNLTACRTYEVKVDWQEMFPPFYCDGEGSTPKESQFFTMNVVYDHGVPIYLERMDLNMMLKNFPLSNPAMVGKYLKLTFTIRAKNSTVCPSEQITQCIRISNSPPLNPVMKLVQSTLSGGGYVDVDHTPPISTSPLCGLYTAAFRLNYNGALTQYLITLDAVDINGNLFTNLVSNYSYLAPTSGGLPDFNMNIIDIPPNAMVNWAGGVGYFGSQYQNPGAHLYYKISVVAVNGCGLSSPQWSFFRINAGVLTLKQKLDQSGRSIPTTEYDQTAISGSENSYTDAKLISHTGDYPDDDFVVYPNPLSQVLMVSGLKSADRFVLINVSGAIVINLMGRGVSQYIDVSGLAPGIYVWRHYGGRMTYQSGKLIKL